MIYSVVLISTVQQSDLVIYIYICVCVCVCVYTYTHIPFHILFHYCFSQDIE